MALTQVGTSQVGVLNGVSAALPVPAGLSTNDLVVVTGKVNYPADGNTIAAPAGFVAVPGAAFHMTTTDTANDHWQMVSFYKYVAGDSGTWTFTWTTTADYSFTCGVLRGAPTANPIDIAATLATTYSGPSQPAASQAWAGLTLGQANEYVIAWFSNDNSYSYSAISGWFNRAGGVSLQMFDKLFTASGATGAITAVANNTCDQTATLIAIRSAALPANTVLPTITGTATEGLTLTEHDGTWTGSPSFAYQWNRDLVPISLATFSTYVLQPADIGHAITVTVTATNSAGSATATSIPTASVAAAGTAPDNVTLPVISGSLVQWATLTVTTGTWNGAATITYAYQWQRNAVDIPSATAASYGLILADVGQNIDCVVTATNGSGSTPATSATVGPVAASPNAPVLGQTLATDNGVFTSDTPITYTYQWLRDSATIPAATSSLYVIQQVDVGHALSVTVTATNIGGSTSQTSAPTGLVLAAPTIASAPTITGQAVQGQNLTASTGVWNNAPTGYAYQWNRDGTPIAAATNSTYTLVAGDVGHVITVTVTASNLVGSASSTSAGTASVTGSGATPFTISLSGHTISWSAFTGATSYTAVGFADARPHAGAPVLNYIDIGNVLSWTPPSAPGQTVFYGVAANAPSGGVWCTSEVSIAWASAPAGTVKFGVNAPPWGGNTSFGVSGGKTLAQDLVDSGFRYFRQALDEQSTPSDVSNYYLNHPELSMMVLFSGSYNHGGGMVAFIGSDLGQSWANAKLSQYQSYINNSQCIGIEVGNEVYGDWFWGTGATSQANAEAYGYLVKTFYTTFHNKLGSSCPPILANVFGNGAGVGQPVGSLPSWWSWLVAKHPDIASYYDGVILHPYGGTGDATLSAQGNRNAVLSARTATGKPVYMSEVGWPSGAQSGITTPTGDSLQWTEAQQSANITNLVAWSKAQAAGTIGALMLYSYLDDASPGLYGLCYGTQDPAGATFRHKPAFAAYVGAI